MLLVCYVGYTAYLISMVFGGQVSQFDSILGTELASKTGFEVVSARRQVSVLRTPSPSSGAGKSGENRFSGRVVGKWLCEMTSAFIIKELRGARALRLFCCRSSLLHFFPCIQGVSVKRVVRDFALRSDSDHWGSLPSALPTTPDQPRGRIRCTHQPETVRNKALYHTDG